MSENEIGLEIDIGHAEFVVVNKLGWQYLWVRYATAEPFEEVEADEPVIVEREAGN